MGQGQSTTEISGDRRRLVTAAQQKWIRQLIDLSRRNTLLYFRAWKLASAELIDWDQDALQRLLSGETVALTELLPADKELARRIEARSTTVYTEEGADDEEVVSASKIGLLPKLQAISRKAQENFEERGMETMYLACGMATWTAADGGRNPEAAVLLLPIRVEGVGRRTSLTPRGDLETNLALLYQLEQLGCEDLTDQLQNAIADPDAIASGKGLDDVLQILERKAAHLTGFEIQDRVVIGNFSFEKLAMVKDLQAHLEALIKNNVVAALAGDVQAAADLRNEWREAQIDPRTLDLLPAAEEFLIAPADSSQQAALVMVGRGQSGVISGPPGTGKSQTITNLIASLVAAGKSVLFVAQKRAALDVVQRRLEVAGLAHLVLDLHGVSKKADVMRSFGESYEMVRSSSLVDAAALDTRFEERRKQLNDHVARLHRKRSPSGLSAYELQAAVLAMPETTQSSVRWRGDSLKRLTAFEVSRLEDLVQDAAGQPKLFLRDNGTRWAGAKLRSEADVSTALASVAELRNRVMEQLLNSARIFAEETRLSATTLTETRAGVDLSLTVRGLLSKYRPEFFALDLNQAHEILASKSGLGRMLASMFDAKYQSARRQIISMRSSPAPDRALVDDLRQAIGARDAWIAQSNRTSMPFVAASADQLQAALAAFDATWQKLKPLLPWGNVETASMANLDRWISQLAKQEADAYRVPRLCEIEEELHKAGFDALVTHLRTERPAPGLWAQILRFAYLQSCLEAAWLEDSQLAAFNGRRHDLLIDEFKALDAQRTQVAAGRVRHAHAKRAIEIRNSKAEQDAVVKAESKKKKRHMPVRRLIAQAPNVVTALRPCWMASPLSVSQLLAGDSRYFDVVIFDEASQVLPEDAVTSILRGATVVVAGDEKQLPPTPFFASGLEETQTTSDEPEPVEGYESVLEIMGKVFDPWDLIWHYRSQDERLIAFSNRHIYSDRLITFPGVGLVEPVRLIQVHQEIGVDGQEESSSAEVQRVVELILEHAITRSEESLGVIAMGIKHAYRIEAELARQRLVHPELDPFLNGVLHKEERFFIKNLERVQGDERDAIILSMGYGKNRAGTLSLNFGPLTNSKMGHRRLNVSVTRAKRRVTVVASFTAADMDPKRLNALGMKLTREYLEYASSGGNILGDAGQLPVALNGFEESVMRTLESKGLRMIPQYGTGSYRLDFAVEHPTKPGQFVMALECDGASYHSANTARDRDRLRQEHLELLGWRFCRIWSTDWYRDRETEAARVVEAFRHAVREADERGNVTRTNPEAPPTPEPPRTIAPTDVRSESQGSSGTFRLPRGLDIYSYTRQQLQGLKTSIEGDGQLRTKEELLREMTQRLGYERLGGKIRTRLEAIIDGRDFIPRSERRAGYRHRYGPYRRR